MSNVNKFLGIIAGITISVNATNASAQQNSTDAVLFKIHNVESLKNNDGDIVACNFNATFYNRTDKDLTGIEMKLDWNDEVIKIIIEEEKANPQKDELGNPIMKEASYTEKVTPVAVSADVKIPELKAHRQVTIPSKIKADRCFLLLGDATFNVSSCSEGKEKPVKNKLTKGMKYSATASGCSGLFQFISSKDPDYYREFKEISYSDEKSQKRNDREKESKELNKVYSETVDALNQVSDTLSKLK